MNKDYNEGWRSACDCIMDMLDVIAPPQHAVIVTADRIRELIRESRATAFDDPRENLSEQEQRLLKYGIRP